MTIAALGLWLSGYVCGVLSLLAIATWAGRKARQRLAREQAERADRQRAVHSNDGVTTGVYTSNYRVPTNNWGRNG